MLGLRLRADCCLEKCNCCQKTSSCVSRERGHSAFSPPHLPAGADRNKLVQNDNTRDIFGRNPGGEKGVTTSRSMHATHTTLCEETSGRRNAVRM